MSHSHTRRPLQQGLTMPPSNNRLRLPKKALIALFLTGTAAVTACGHSDSSSSDTGTTTPEPIPATTSAPSADDSPTTSTLPASTLPATTALPAPSEKASAATSTAAPTPTSTTTTTTPVVTSTTAAVTEPTLPQRSPTQSTTTTTVAESNCAIALEVVDGTLGEARQVDIRVESEQRDDYLHVELNWADERVRLALYISPAGIGTTRVDAPGTAPISARVYATSSFQPSGVRCRT